MTKTNYFLFLKYLDQKYQNIIGLDLYTYLICREFGTGIYRERSGIYFKNKIDPKRSNEIIEQFETLTFFRKVKIRYKSKLFYRKVLNSCDF